MSETASEYCVWGTVVVEKWGDDLSMHSGSTLCAPICAGMATERSIGSFWHFILMACHKNVYPNFGISIGMPCRSFIFVVKKHQAPRPWSRISDFVLKVSHLHFSHLANSCACPWTKEFSSNYCYLLLDVKSRNKYMMKAAAFDSR